MLRTHWHCWEITNCKGSEECPARANEDVPCWELARELNDYRNALNVCEDCIVYVTKMGNQVLPEEEIMAVLTEKGVCALAAACSQYEVE